MKSKKEIEIFLNEKFNELRKELIDFIFQEDDTEKSNENDIIKKSNIFLSINPSILESNTYVDFEYPFVTKEETFGIRFSKENRCISAYYNNELIFDGNVSTYKRYYKGRGISKKFNVCEVKGKDIKFNGSVYFLAKRIFDKIPGGTTLNESKINNFIIDTVKPYLKNNVFFKDEK